MDKLIEDHPLIGAAVAVGLTILCFVVDPILFKGDDDGWLSFMRLGVYLSAGIGLATLLWEAMFPYLTGFGQQLRGHILIVGGRIAFLIAFTIVLPASIFIAIPAAISSREPNLFLLSALGLAPAVVGVIFSRYGRQVLIRDDDIKLKLSPTVLVIALCITIGIPTIIQVRANQFVRHHVNAITQTDVDSANSLAQLESAFWCTNSCYCPILRAYRQSDDETEKERFNISYEVLVGYRAENEGLSKC